MSLTAGECPVIVRLAGVKVGCVRCPSLIALVEFEAIMHTSAALVACPGTVTYQWGLLSV